MKNATKRGATENNRKEIYDRRKTLLNEAATEQRAIRDCKKKIDYLLARGKDTSFSEGSLMNHRRRYEEIIQEVSCLELHILTENSSKLLNGLA